MRTSRRTGSGLAVVCTTGVGSMWRKGYHRREVKNLPEIVDMEGHLCKLLGFLLEEKEDFSCPGGFSN